MRLSSQAESLEAGRSNEMHRPTLSLSLLTVHTVRPPNNTACYCRRARSRLMVGSVCWCKGRLGRRSKASRRSPSEWHCCGVGKRWGARNLDGFVHHYCLYCFPLFNLKLFVGGQTKVSIQVIVARVRHKSDTTTLFGVPRTTLWESPFPLFHNRNHTQVRSSAPLHNAK